MPISSNTYRVLLALAILIGFGIILNPWIVRGDGSSDPVGDGVLTAFGVAGVAWCGVACLVRLRSERAAGHDEPAVTPDPPEAGPVTWTELALHLVVVALWVAMFWRRWSDPNLSTDDNIYIALSRNWQVTRDNLFAPFAEHLCPVTRLWTWLVCSVVDEQHRARALATSGLVLFAATFPPLAVFVRREWGSPALSLIAVSLFALTRVHDEVVMWYSASQWCWSLLLLLSSLLVAQSNASRGSTPAVAVCVILAAVGPFFYLVGLLVGPVTAVYLACSRRGSDARAIPIWRSALPLAGTAAFLAVFVPMRLVGVLSHASYGGTLAIHSVAPLRGVLYGLRSTADLLMLRNLGSDYHSLLSRAVYAALFFAAVFGVVTLIRRTNSPRPVLVGCVLVLLSYAITLPFRAWVQYADFVEWTRYQLFPQLGVVFVVCGAVVTWCSRWLTGPELSPRGVCFVLLLACIQFAIHAIT